MPQATPSTTPDAGQPADTSPPAAPEPAPEPIPGVDDIFDIEPPVEVPWWEPWMLWTAIPILSIIVAVAVYFIIRQLMKARRKSRVQIAREVALNQILALETSVSGMDGHEFGIAVSDVVRSYLTKARGLRATNQTSYEFLNDLKDNARFANDTKVFLADFLGRCDELKFAPNAEGTEPSRALLDGASEFIRTDVKAA